MQIISNHRINFTFPSEIVKFYDTCDNINIRRAYIYRYTEQTTFGISK